MERGFIVLESFQITSWLLCLYLRLALLEDVKEKLNDLDIEDISSIHTYIRTMKIDWKGSHKLVESQVNS